LGSGPNVTMIFGAFHGNERETPGIIWKLMKNLLANPNELLNCTVILVPVSNPDGWLAATRVNAHGVDLNRNFPVGWRDSRSPRYRSGTVPESEPETQSIVALVAKYQPQKIVSIHQPLSRMIYTGPAGKKLALAMQAYIKLPVTDHSVRSTPGSFGMYCGDGLHVAIVTLELSRHPEKSEQQKVETALLAAVRSPVGPKRYAHRTPRKIKS
jgi:protein MpaA